MSTYKSYYEDKKEQGKQYEDWVSEQLRKANPGLIIGSYGSRKFQIEKGESFSGVEIKNDDMLKKTHNLYIETAEKSNPQNKDYITSGIYRHDNSIFFIIGDYTEVFMFSTKQLRKIIETKDWHSSYKIKKRISPTSIGYTISRNKVLGSIFLLNHWVFDEEAVKKNHPGEIIK